MQHIYPKDRQELSLHMRDIGTINPYMIYGALEELDNHPELWNEYEWRTENARSPHREADDIWLRYNALENFDPEHPQAFNNEHKSVWYPSAEKLPAIRYIVETVAHDLQAHTIGGVLITRVPAGKQIYWHQDGGWHAGYYRKFLVVLRGNHEQSFEFENEQMFSEPGDCFEFQNEYPHRVLNPTDKERISLIICLRDFDKENFVCRGAH